MQFRKKPVVIDAFQIPSPMTTPGETPDWVLEATVNADLVWHKTGGVDVVTLEGTMFGAVGDWIIRGVEGEIYPCRADVFEATHEAVEPEGA